MKKTLLFVSLFVLSLSAQAKKMTCEIGTVYAKSGGLMPMAENFKMSVDVSNLDKASTQEHHGYKLSLYASETEYVGVYSAVVAVDLISDQSVNGDQGLSAVDLVTKKSNQKLDIMTRETSYLSPVLDKLFKANIEYDLKDTGDSALMDEAVVKAIKSNVLKEGEIMLFSIKDCQISK